MKCYAVIGWVAICGSLCMLCLNMWSYNALIVLVNCSGIISSCCMNQMWHHVSPLLWVFWVLLALCMNCSLFVLLPLFTLNSLAWQPLPFSKRFSSPFFASSLLSFSHFLCDEAGQWMASERDSARFCGSTPNVVKAKSSAAMLSSHLRRREREWEKKKRKPEPAWSLSALCMRLRCHTFQ